MIKVDFAPLPLSPACGKHGDRKEGRGVGVTRIQNSTSIYIPTGQMDPSQALGHIGQGGKYIFQWLYICSCAVADSSAFAHASFLITKSKK